jgi:hypothetical protein
MQRAISFTLNGKPARVKTDAIADDAGSGAGSGGAGLGRCGPAR